MTFGTVRTFDSADGCGYVHPEDGRDDLLFFVSHDDDTGQALRRGDHVEFGVIYGPKGPEAADVHVALKRR